MFSNPIPGGQYAHASQGFAVVDLETTGLDPAHDRIVEIAIVRIDATGRELGVYETLVDPGTEIGGTSVHGITREQLARAPSFGGIAPAVLAWFEGVVVSAHNATFEEAFLQAEFARLGWPPPHMPALDTLWLSRTTLPLTNHRLGTLCDWYGVELIDAHTATGDARATAQVLGQMLPTLTHPLRWDVPLPRYGCSVSGGYLPRRTVPVINNGSTLEE